MRSVPTHVSPGCTLVVFIQPQLLPFTPSLVPRTPRVVRYSQVQLAAKPGWCCRSTDRTYSYPRPKFSSPDIEFHWCNRQRSYYLTTRDFYHAGPLLIDPIKISSCNITSHFLYSEYRYNSIYRVTTPETSRVTVSWIHRSR